MQNMNNPVNHDAMILLMMQINDMQITINDTQHSLRDLEGAITKLKQQRKMVLSELAYRDFSNEELKELEWKLSDIELAIEINKKGGLSGQAISVNELMRNLLTHQRDLARLLNLLQVLH